MKYISGIHALNLNCNLETCGDWHQSAIQWDAPYIKDTNNSVFGEYGLEFKKSIPEHTGDFVTANHIRALLDMLDDGQFSYAQGMRDNYICNDNYTNEIFHNVVKLRNNQNWNKIDSFMEKEYKVRWLLFKKGMGL